MAESAKKARGDLIGHHISILELEQNFVELYFWLRGNPFELTSGKLELNTFDEDWRPDQSSPKSAQEMLTALVTNSSIGYVALTPTVVIVGCERIKRIPKPLSEFGETTTMTASRIMFDTLAFLGSTKFADHIVRDKKGEAVAKQSLKRRLIQVRHLEAQFARRGLPMAELAASAGADTKEPD